MNESVTGFQIQRGISKATKKQKDNNDKNKKDATKNDGKKSKSAPK